MLKSFATFLERNEIWFCPFFCGITELLYVFLFVRRDDLDGAATFVFLCGMGCGLLGFSAALLIVGWFDGLFKRKKSA